MRGVEKISPSEAKRIYQDNRNFKKEGEDE